MVTDAKPEAVESSDPIAEPPAAAGESTAERYQHLLSAFVALAAGAGLVGAALSGATALVVVVAVVQAALIAAWFVAGAVPGRWGTAVLGVAAAAAADVVVMQWPHGELGTLLAVLGFVQIAAFGHQLARGVARSQIVVSMGRTELLLVAVIALAALVQLRHGDDGRAMTVAVVIASAGALAEGHLVDLAWAGPRIDPEVRRGLLAVIVSVVVSGGLTWAWLHHEQVLTDQRAILLGVALGLITSLFAISAAFILQNLGAEQAPGSAARPLIAVLLALALAAPVAYLLVSAVQG